MYDCSFCGKTSKSGEACKLVTTSRRSKEYPSVKLKPKLGDFMAKKYGDAGKGWEIAEEKKMCLRCSISPENAKTVTLSDRNYITGKPGGDTVGELVEAKA